MENVDHDCFGAVDYFLAVLEVGQFDARVVFFESGSVLFEPLVLGHEDVFLLFVGDEDILQYHAGYLG